MYEFRKARPVWGERLTRVYNQHLGFGTEVTVPENSRLLLAVAARSYYRMYINGEMRAHGPARAAKGFCRVDELEIQASGRVRIAVEVMAYSKDVNYCNDCTMEPGLLCSEISLIQPDQTYQVLAATGDGDFKYQELTFREEVTDLLSHCRGIREHYLLAPDWDQWQTESLEGEQWKEPALLREEVVFLERRAPYADYHRIPMEQLLEVKKVVPGKPGNPNELQKIAEMFNPGWYEKLKGRERFVDQLLGEQEEIFTGRWTRQCDKIILPNLQGDVAFLFGRARSELGFVKLQVETEKPLILDVINSDVRNRQGQVDGNTFAVRYELLPGSYELIMFEPMLVKYLKLILRTEGRVEFTMPKLLDDTYPDRHLCTFDSSDGELNLIYEGARRTLRLNTLDIFMDCPQRERGGWLCDAQFTAPGAWMMFGDLRVEKDFIENFMCTRPEDYKEAFFPEVYPGSPRLEKSPGIQSWSFWLLTQFWDYAHRSGDRAFVDECFDRVQAFLDRVSDHVGESGLFENFDILFVDWSLSNAEFCLYPISIPVNCLIVLAYERMGELYQVERWKQLGARVRARIEEVMEQTGGDSDGCRFEEGRWIGNGCRTETGIALEFWCGFHQKDKELIRRFTEEMGTAPRYRPDPNLGRSNLFIGLMIRFEALAKLGKIQTLLGELKNVYLPQLLNGPGTFYEGIHDPSGCHGFNANAGAMIVNYAAGLGQPMQALKTVKIAPHPGALLWASAGAFCEDGPLFLFWRADHQEHMLDMELLLPEGWKPKVELPFELAGWRVRLNGKEIQ